MYTKFFKRVIDIVLSGIGLIVLIIPMTVIAIVIYCEEPGSVIFKQKRVGLHKKYFNLYKFRTMSLDTPHDVPTHMLKNPERYILKVGGFLRKSSIDELPQLWNILRGDMSIIGPRPALWNQEDLIAERDKYGANDVRPGLSGWAQINGRDELTIDEKAKLDGEYVEKMSFSMDMKCFFGTFIKVFKRVGVVEGGTGEMKKKEERTMNTREFIPFEKKVYLSSPTMHGDELKYMTEAYETNWMSTVGKNIDEVERLAAEKTGCKYSVALSCGTAALHLSMKLAGIKPGDKVFCSDMTFDATVNPVVYEGGVPIFIDTEYDTWNMDPVALEKAFELYPEVKAVVVAHLYGTPGKMDEIRAVCDKYGAVIIEDAAESFGATYKGKQTGTFGDFGVISFNGNKIITGSAGGMLLTDDLEVANKVRKWATQSRENAPWYQHEELGYNYRMSNVIAGVVRGQLPYLEEHIAQKKAIYERYKEGFRDLPVSMNPLNADGEGNYWLSCMIIHPEAMCKQVRGENEALYITEQGKSCPTEILETLAKYNAEGRPIWKPMHMQPIYRMNPFITREGDGRAKTNAYIAGGAVGRDGKPLDVGMDIFHRGLCLPSDNKMTVEQQDRIIEMVKSCFE